MKIKGILFDKDGTLFALDGVWIKICRKLVDSIIYNFKLEEKFNKKMLSVLGIINDKIESDSLLASGTIRQSIRILYSTVRNSRKNNIDYKKFYNFVFERLKKYYIDFETQIQTLADLDILFKRLKEQGFYIGLATADLKETVIYLLKTRGLIHYFDYIGTDDGYVKPKPDPEMLVQFCRKCNINNNEVAVVGDSIVDMEFARNGKAGLAIGIIKNNKSNNQVTIKSDLIFNNIQELINDDFFARIN